MLPLVLFYCLYACMYIGSAFKSSIHVPSYSYQKCIFRESKRAYTTRGDFPRNFVLVEEISARFKVARYCLLQSVKMQISTSNTASGYLEKDETNVMH